MSTHNSVIELFLKLGYTKIEGLCHGLAIRWLEACFLGEEGHYDARINRINKLVSSKEDIVQLVNVLKAKKGKSLTKEDKELFDLLAFFDSVELYHSPGEHSALFNRSYKSASIDIISQSDFASSDKIRSKGGLAQIYSEPMILTTAELTKYLEDLGKVLQKDGVAKDTFGVVLTSINHSIALNYKPNVGWGFMDINQYPAQFFKLDKPNAVKIIAEKIMSGFDFNKKGGPIAFNASVITTQNSASIPKLTQKLKQFKETHIMTKELALREKEGVGLALIAAQQGHVSVIADLGKYKADLNKAGFTPAYVAATNGHVAVIEELAKHKADLNKADKEGCTPAYTAAAHGYFLVIAELAKHKADINKAQKDGYTPAYIAANNGHVSVIKELAKHKVDLNKVTGSGYTPAYIAAAKGHVSVLIELIRSGVDIKTPSRMADDALRELASPYGTGVVSRAEHFITQKLNRGNRSFLMTPSDIAVVMGHKEVIQILSKQVIQTYFNNKYFKVAPSGENKDKSEPLNDVTKVPKYFKSIKDIKLKKMELELKIRDVELLLDAAKKNEEKVVGRKYFINFIDEHKSQYAAVLNTIKGTPKDEMIKKEAQQRKASIASRVLYGASCATSLITTGYRFFTPKGKQEYVESFLPDTLDSQCKAEFKKLAKNSIDQLKEEIIEVNKEMHKLCSKNKKRYKEVQPFLEAIAAKDLAELLPEGKEVTKQETTKIQVKTDKEKNPIKNDDVVISVSECRKM
jgi:hypothetical protein